MKTHSTSPRVLAVLCSAIALCIVSSVSVHAQSYASPGSGVAKGLFTHGNDAYRVVNTAGYRTAADVGSAAPGTVQQVNYAGACTSCGTSCGGSCGGSYGPSMGVQMGMSNCGSCGTACGGTCRNSMLSCGPKNIDPCAPCTPYRYGSIEVLYMDRDDNGFNHSGVIGLSDFDFEFGARIVVGAVTDCVHGYEASLVGPFSWDTAVRQNSPVTTSRVVSLATLIPSGTTGPAVLTDILTETRILNSAQRLNTDYFSVDASKTLNGWEFSKLLLGGRFLSYDEEFNASGNFETTQTRIPRGGGATETTTVSSSRALRNDVQNRLLGLQVGMDLLYPISRFAFSDLRMRAGAYANFADMNYQLVGNDATVSVPAPVFAPTATPINSRVSRDSIELAGLFEIGTGIRYQVGEILSVRAGAELWYLSGVASATDRIGTLQSASSNPRLKADNDILFTGLSLGAELRY
ncbi:hypothetical protein Poly51_42190 [Rubripirellula tenax]|uniref:Uncharacterized protein n=1 Tax=Rubripirellula tenax TaxID=2528015 RepID=A0A5C6ETK1_9BACT|nr:hypothetical protein [Rubripirellula tenax]TWU50926.1 hypothetical protein Poly51_42190 [Rubripirellula tenax]